VPDPDSISSNGIDEPAVTPEIVYLPVHWGKEKSKPTKKAALDWSFLSMDGLEQILKQLVSALEKRRGVQKKASKSKKAKRFLQSIAEGKSTGQKHQIEIARAISSKWVLKN